jgi:excisionase family DNA binding protein
MEKSNWGNDWLAKDRDTRIREFVQSLDAIREDIRRIVENSRPTLNGERYLTDKELSERISVSRRTLHEWRTNEIIGYIQLGGKVLYRESDVLKLIEKNFHKPYEGV